MKKIWVVVLGVVLAGCAPFTPDEQRQIESVDGLVYSFIVGKVEGNDDLLADVLAEDAQGIIQPGRHAYPGDAEEMGERYSVKRYDHKFRDGLLTYEVTFFRPSTGKDNYYIVAAVNTENGWEIASNSSMDEHFLNGAKRNENGEIQEPETVHTYRGGE